MKSNVLILLALNLAFTLSIPVLLYPVADSYLVSGSTFSNTNFGSDVDGFALRDMNSGDYFDLVMKFNITNLPTTIVSANVTYMQQYLSDDEISQGPFLIYDVWTTDTLWTESGVTWANPPSKVTKILSNYQDGRTDRISFPVGSAINAAKAAGKQVVSFLVHSESSLVTVYMRESPAQNRPSLVAQL